MDQELWNDDRIKVMSYEVMIEFPQECLEALSEFVGIELPLSIMKRRIHPAAAVHGELRPDVERLCSKLLGELGNVPGLLRR